MCFVSIHLSPVLSTILPKKEFFDKFVVAEKFDAL